MLDLLIAASGQVAGALRPDVLLGDGPTSLRAALQTATVAAFKPLAMLGGVLLCIGLVQNLIRQNDAPREMLMTIARVFVLAVLMVLSQRPEWRGLLPAISSSMAESITKTSNGAKGPLQRVSHFVELIYPAEDLQPVQGVEAKGAASASWSLFGRAADAVFGAIALTVRTLIAQALVMGAFVLLYVGWVIGLVVNWLSIILFEYGWLLVPLALGALGVESLRGVGNTYLLGLASVGCGQMALALAHVGTHALMIWVAALLRSITAVPGLTNLIDGPANDFVRGKFVNSISLLPMGGLLGVFLAFLVLAAWIVVSPVFAWKVFIGTMRTGAQFGSRLGFAFAGATLRAAGNAADAAGTSIAAKAGGKSAAKGTSKSSSEGGGPGSEAQADASMPPSERGAAPAIAERSTPAPGAVRPRLSGEKLAAVRQRVSAAAIRGEAAGKSDSEIELMCRSVAIQSGASAAEATDLVRNAQSAGPESAGGVDGRRGEAPAAPVRSNPATPPSLPAETPPTADAPASTPAYALVMGGAVLRRASAHANEGFPDPTDHALVAARQRAARPTSEQKSE